MRTKYNIFKDVYDVIQECVLKQKYAVVYYPNAGTIERAGVMVTGTCEIIVDHLPREGYSSSKYQPDEYGKKLQLLVGDIYPFWETMFLKENKYYKVLFLKTGEVREAKVTMVPSGVGRKYCLEYREAGKEAYFSREAYEAEFVILKESTKK